MPHRRSVLVGAGTAITAIFPAGATAVSRQREDASSHVGNLLVDGLVDPRGLHTEAPRLSWQICSDRRGARQTAWRVGVASSRAAVDAGRYDLWDSGRIGNDRCFDIPYRGPQLTSRARLWWRVTVWDERGVAATSAAASWEMGLLSPADWTATWLSAETPAQRQDRAIGLRWRRAPAGERGGMQGFRLRVTLPHAAEVAMMVACDTNARVFVDGRLVIDPRPNGWGNPGPWTVLETLPAGDHVVAIEARQRGDAPVQAAALLRATFADGSVARYSGETMRAAPAPEGAWTTVGYPDAGWARTAAARGGAPMPARAATLLRTRFRVDGEVASARLYLTALGLYEAEINGRRLDDALLRPEFTDYRAHCLYGVDDVIDRLTPGDNVLGVHVADGWYGSYVAPTGRYSFGDAPLRLLGQLEIRYADGRRQTVATGDDWLVAESPITSATIYDGETYDATREQPGWSAPDFRPGPRWHPAVAAPTPAAVPVAATVPPIRRQEPIRPKTVSRLADGSSVVDFGQNFAGWARILVRAPRGRTVALRYAELLNADGSVDQTNLRRALATDRYTFRGDAAPEYYEPRFTYHGFRYVQVEGLDRPIAADEIVGIPIRSDLPETSDLRLDAYVPQRLWTNSRWSQRSNFMGIPTDCPQRDERLGWMGDAHVFWDAASFNMDTAAFTQRFMRDVRDAQRTPGDYPDIAPNADTAHFTPPGSSPGWGDAGVALPWTAWQRYGDTAIIDQHWASMERFLASIRANNPDFVWSKARGNDYADWLALEAAEPGDPTTPKDLVGTAMWKGAADQMVDMARAAGRGDDHARYAQLAAAIARAFRQRFVRADGSIGNGSQTGYILALHFDLLDSAQRPEAVRRLVADIRRRGTLLSTGFLGTPYSLDVLADAGEDALVYDLLLRTDFPSWGYMIAKGATTTWERWNGDAGDRSMNSFNHYALGAVVGFLFRRVAGIDPIAPGFARFAVRPVLDPRLETASARYDSRVGRIEVRWQRLGDEGLALDLLVPPNAVATVHLPARDEATVREGGRPLSADFQAAAGRDGRIVLQVPAGRYDFRTA